MSNTQPDRGSMLAPLQQQPTLRKDQYIYVYLNGCAAFMTIAVQSAIEQGLGLHSNQANCAISFFRLGGHILPFAQLLFFPNAGPLHQRDRVARERVFRGLVVSGLAILPHSKNLPVFFTVTFCWSLWAQTIALDSFQAGGASCDETDSASRGLVWSSVYAAFNFALIFSSAVAHFLKAYAWGPSVWLVVAAVPLCLADPLRAHWSTDSHPPAARPSDAASDHVTTRRSGVGHASTAAVEDAEALRRVSRVLRHASRQNLARARWFLATLALVCVFAAVNMSAGVALAILGGDAIDHLGRPVIRAVFTRRSGG